MESPGRTQGSAGEAIVDSALEFHLVYLDGTKIVKRRLADYESMVLPVIKNLQKALEDEMIRQSEPGKWVEWLLKAYEFYKKNSLAYHTHIVLSTIEKLGTRIQQEIEKFSIKIPSGATVEAAPKVSQPLQAVQKEKQPVAVTAQLPTITKGTVEDAILQTLRTVGAMSIQEIEQQIKSQGYEADIRSTVFRLVLQGKLKVVLA